ncbi:alpha-L-fucosidase [Carboxylicivirga sediminis]|uniref:alpha-L-fucosidase n=1 Tax=Carboxylicivirga sediminis TaxID=2006564 RepID=A0A941F9Z5_9BACT|nr:alpha-L-fucosidase [Carboxylicivirga sediminis]MBR8537425.1 alpha-L-fucosidase [Carboxylicivirga sediminis]
MKKILLITFLCLLYMGIGAQQAAIWNETPAEKQERMAWWTHDRFGMFIHWGLYALPARHEWVKMRERMDDEAYQKYFDYFNPDLYDATEWARQAKAAGMKYVVLTVKHHEGFCLFDSQYTDYKVTNTPIGRDLVKEYVEALRAEGLKVGFYYSLIDWHHPDFTVDRIHPLRTDDAKQLKAMNKERDMAKYRKYLHNQVREILTNYGQIDILWLDYSYPGNNGKGRDDWDSVELLKMVRQLQPGILVNDRLDLKDVKGGWDFTTPEQFKPSKWVEIDGQRVPWETCQTFSGSWGYYRDEHTWKDTKQLLVLLIESVSNGGNLLLNVGPTARGVFDYRAQERLKAMGQWMKFNDRAIYGCTQAPEQYKVPPHTILTYNASTHRLYIHLVDYPMGDLILPGYEGKIAYAQFLHDGSEIKMSTRRHGYGPAHEQNVKGNIVLKLPVVKPLTEIPVIELILND